MKRLAAGLSLLVLLLAPAAQAQTLLGIDGGGAIAWEFTPATGGACPAPTPLIVPCPYATATCSGVPCTPTPAYLHGLALSQHGNAYGAPRITAKLRPFGQSTTPSTNFGIDVLAAPPGTNAWFIMNFNLPGPGYLCPSIGAVGTKLWVDPSPPAILSNLGPLPAGPCIPLTLIIPPLLPTGLEAFIQIVFIPFSGPPAADATNAVALTLMLP